MGLPFPVITTVLKKKPKSKSSFSWFRGRQHHGNRMLGVQGTGILFFISRCTGSWAIFIDDPHILLTFLFEKGVALSCLC